MSTPKKASPIWDFFIVPDPVNNPGSAKCLECNDTVSRGHDKDKRKMNTSNMISHLKICHRDKYDEYMAKRPMAVPMTPGTPRTPATPRTPKLRTDVESVIGTPSKVLFSPVTQKTSMLHYLKPPVKRGSQRWDEITE